MDTALLMRNTFPTLILRRKQVNRLESFSVLGLVIRGRTEVWMRVELVVSDSCLVPEFTESDSLLRVQIGLNHDFDDILDLCGKTLSNEQLTRLHRLWNDDDFPRSFRREGDSLIITARE